MSKNGFLTTFSRPKQESSRVPLIFLDFDCLLKTWTAKTSISLPTAIRDGLPVDALETFPKLMHGFPMVSSPRSGELRYFDGAMGSNTFLRACHRIKGELTVLKLCKDAAYKILIFSSTVGASDTHL